MTKEAEALVKEALAIWEERRAFLQVELSKTSDPKLKFTIQKEIKEAKTKIDELEEQLAKEPAPSAWPSVWRVPHRLNPHFVGRTDLIDQIYQTLRSRHYSIQVLQGLGGIGKTELAVQYLNLHSDDYEVVWWVRAEEPTTLSKDYGSLAARIGLSEKDRDEETRRQKVRASLEQNSRWILIFDNVNNPERLARYLPQPRPDITGHVLVTSRHRGIWPSDFNTLTVPPLERSEASRLLCHRTGEQNREAAAELAEVLGDLPLALEQAAAYVKLHSRSLSDYLTLFGEHRKQLLASPQSQNQNKSSESVNTTWLISFEMLRKSSPAATDLLYICAFLAADGIPQDLFLRAGETLPKTLRSASKNPTEWDQVVTACESYSLIKRSGDGLWIHRLVQAVIRDLCGDQGTAKSWTEAAIRLVNGSSSFDLSDVGIWPWSARLFPHTLAILRRAKAMEIKTIDCATLSMKAGLYCYNKAQFMQALGHFERALKIEEAVAPRRASIAIHINNIGQTLQELGDLDSALACAKCALRISEAVYGQAHPNVATNINNVGAILWAKGNSESALEHAQRALEMAEKVYDADHPDIAVFANNVGQILQGRGELDRALHYVDRALRIDLVIGESRQLTTAIRLSNAAQVLQESGNLDRALELVEQALRITAEICGEAHPHVAVYLDNVGQILYEKGELSHALEHSERSLGIVRATYGLWHPAVATVANNIGRILKAMGHLDKALQFAQQALRIDNVVHGSEPSTAVEIAGNIDRLLRDREKPILTLGILPQALVAVVSGSRKIGNDRNIRQILMHRGHFDIILGYPNPAGGGGSTDVDEYRRLAEHVENLAGKMSVDDEIALRAGDAKVDEVQNGTMLPHDDTIDNTEESKNSAAGEPTSVEGIVKNAAEDFAWLDEESRDFDERCKSSLCEEIERRFYREAPRYYEIFTEGVSKRPLGEFPSFKKEIETQLDVKSVRTMAENQNRPKDEDAMLGKYTSFLIDYRNSEGAAPSVAAEAIKAGEVLGARHPSVVRDAHNISTILREKGEFDDALNYAFHALNIAEDVFGVEHFNTAILTNNVGQIFRDRNQLPQALRYTRQALHALRQNLGGGHPSTRAVANNLAVIERTAQTQKEGRN